MPVDILILNTAVTDLRRPEFEFADKLVGKGGLAKCKREDMPKYSQEQIHRWIEDVSDKRYLATAGGPGNCAPLIAAVGLEVAVGVMLGEGKYMTSDSKFRLDAQGRFFYDTMINNGVDMSSTVIHPDLSTGTTFMHITGQDKDGRGGIAYFPNANDDFNFHLFKKCVNRLNPKIVYYMYSGLSKGGDANNGQDLADFIRWCREEKDARTIVDSHTLTGDPGEVIKSGKPIDEYNLLRPLLPVVDIFFTSSYETKMIVNTFGWWGTSRKSKISDYRFPKSFLNSLRYRTKLDEGRTRLFGVTFSKGAFYTAILPTGQYERAKAVESRFMAGENVDLVGAGDSFRAGLISYIARNLDGFKDGNMNFEEAVQMGNLFASLYIKAPLDDRYGNIMKYDVMDKIIKDKKVYKTFAQLQADLRPPVK